MHWNTRHHGLLRSSLLESLAPTLKSDTRRFGQTIGTVNRLASLDCSEPLTLCSYCMPSSGEVAVCFSDCWMCSWLNIESRFRNSDRMKSCSSEHVTLRQDRKSSLRGLFKTTSRLVLYKPSSGPRQLCHCWNHVPVQITGTFPGAGEGLCTHSSSLLPVTIHASPSNRLRPVFTIALETPPSL